MCRYALRRRTPSSPTLLMSWLCIKRTPTHETASLGSMWCVDIFTKLSRISPSTWSLTWQRFVQPCSWSFICWAAVKELYSNDYYYYSFLKDAKWMNGISFCCNSCWRRVSLVCSRPFYKSSTASSVTWTWVEFKPNPLTWRCSRQLRNLSRWVQIEH